MLLWIALRRVSDVLLTLVPLLVAAVVTLELCALLDFPLNYANIIALSVLLGVGVAFKIYYVMAWRSGQSDFLQSPLTRAVLFSALMTATAFGSLSFSRHPGTASMGKLLALSLAARSPPPRFFSWPSWENRGGRRKMGSLSGSIRNHCRQALLKGYAGVVEHKL